MCKTKVENTEHIFNCKVATSSRWRKVKRKIRRVIAKVASVAPKSRFPWWFGPNLPVQPFQGKLANFLLEFDKNWGNRGAIPKVLSSYLCKIYKVSPKNLPNTLLNISKIITTAAFKIWCKRCAALETWTNIRYMATK